MYSDEMIIKHLEMSFAHDYFKKFFIYGRSQHRYRQVGGTRALETRERLAVWRKTAKLRNYKFLESMVLFCALAGGLVAWKLGALAARSKDPFAGLPRIG